MTGIQGQEGNTAQIAVSSPEVKNQDSLTSEQLVGALDAQIKFVTDSQRNEGWTRWAIWGALAALVWIATDLITRTDLAMHRAVLASCAVFVLWTLLENLVKILSPSARMHVGPARFLLFTDATSAYRPELTASGLRHLLILIALIYFRFPGQWLLWIYTIAALMVGLLIVFCGMTSVAMPVRLNLRTTFSILTAVQIAFLSAAGWQIISLIRVDLSSYSLADVRLALVLNAGSYLIIRLATATSSEHLLSQLIQLRQHVAFARLPFLQAKQQSESLLSGLELTDVLNPLVESIRKEGKELEPLVIRFQELINETHTRISAMRENHYDEAQNSSIFAETLQILDEVEKQRARIFRKFKSLIRAKNRFDLCAIVISFYSSESRQEAKAIMDIVLAEFLVEKKRVVEAFQQHASLKAEANRVGQSYSPDLVAGHDQ